MEYEIWTDKLINILLIALDSCVNNIVFNDTKTLQ